MKRLTLSLIAALLLAGAAGRVLRSPALFRLDQSGMPSIQDLQTQVNTLPEQEMQDRSVLFTREPAR